MKKMLYFAMALAAAAMTSCAGMSSSNSESETANGSCCAGKTECANCPHDTCTSASGSSSDVLQLVGSDVTLVMYFHGNMRCKTCVVMGQESKKLVTALGNDKVVWKEVDLCKPEGEALGDKFEVNSSGLVIAKGDKWKNLTDMGFRYAYKDPEEFSKRLEAEINKLQQ